MIDLRSLSRRGFLNMSAAGAASLMLPAGLASQAHAAAFPAIKEEEAVVGFGYSNAAFEFGPRQERDGRFGLCLARGLAADGLRGLSSRMAPE